MNKAFTRLLVLMMTCCTLYAQLPSAIPPAGVTSITGTPDQITASAPNGAVVLSLPQSIATTSSPSFAKVLVGTGTDDTYSKLQVAGNIGLSHADAYNANINHNAYYSSGWKYVWNGYATGVYFDDSANGNISFWTGANNSSGAGAALTPTVRLQVTNAGAVKVIGDTFILATAKTPASASAAGVTGQIAWDASYLYICTATNTWRRASHATW